MKAAKSKTRKPIQDRSIETKEKIVQSAYKLVIRNGYPETGIREIVETAEVSIGSDPREN
ncbi:TetR/AcrR family transcriptional regulator [Leptospira yasudae]|uniref:TetR/AcrR family transcriptional regulator n=1 Tax=Leptospira yasudae TaxID=2202201 RepID=UPI001AEFAAB5|nr:TetR family transcriptional regulator [Leptospira yasudae]